uniref:RNA-directed DNA polymerase n=1 Tax=Trichogramma kaykai TaxID=54128 RepID=A0ABD2WQT3_9HYME
MLDNGATVNLIKLSAVAPDVEIFRDRYLSLGGITSEPVETLDYIYVSICSPSYRFYVVPNDFPIEADGLIGRNLMKKEQAVISYHYSSIVLRSDHLNPIPFAEPNPQVENPTTNIFKVSRNRAGIPSINYVAPTTINQYQDYCEDRDFVAECDELCNQATILPERQRITIPGRSRKIIHIGLMHTHLDEGYLPRINLGYDDVYVGEGIVKNEAGYCNIYAINTRVEEVELALDPVEIQPFDYVVQDFESDGATEVDTPPIEDVKTRGDRILKTLRLEELNPEEKENIQKIVTDYPDLFLLPGDSLPCTNWVYHEVPLENNIPINTKQYRHPPIHRDAINKDVEKRLKEGIIEPSSSPMNSPVWIVPKKPGPDGSPKWRVVIDFRELNKKTVGDAYPLPNIADIMDQLGGASYFSTFDLASGFHQIPMKPEDKWKTAFSTLNGHYQYCRMPMGLKNAPATFQRLMDRVLRGLQNTEMLVYLDDIIVYAKDLKEHDAKVRRLLDRLRAARRYIRRLLDRLRLREHIVSEKGVEMDPKKIEVMRNFPQPKTVKQIRQFLGMAGYYRRFIQDFWKIAKPLHDLTKKGKKFDWSSECETSFQTLKDCLISVPILIFPDFTNRSS